MRIYEFMRGMGGYGEQMGTFVRGAPVWELHIERSGTRASRSFRTPKFKTGRAMEFDRWSLVSSSPPLKSRPHWETEISSLSMIASDTFLRQQSMHSHRRSIRVASIPNPVIFQTLIRRWLLTNRQGCVTGVLALLLMNSLSYLACGFASCGQDRGSGCVQRLDLDKHNLLSIATVAVDELLSAILMFACLYWSFPVGLVTDSVFCTLPSEECCTQFSPATSLLTLPFRLGLWTYSSSYSLACQQLYVTTQDNCACQFRMRSKRFCKLAFWYWRIFSDGPHSPGLSLVFCIIDLKAFLWLLRQELFVLVHYFIVHALAFQGLLVTSGPTCMVCIFPLGIWRTLFLARVAWAYCVGIDCAGYGEGFPFTHQKRRQER